MKFHCIALIVLCLPLASVVAQQTKPTSAPETKKRVYVPQRSDSKHARAALRILDPRRLKGRVQEDVSVELAALGPDAIPALFAILSGTLDGPTVSDDGLDEQQRNDRNVRADTLREDSIVLGALQRLPAARVAEAVATAASGRATIDVRLVGMRVLGEIGDAQVLDAWIEIAAQIEAIHLQRAYVEGPIETALANILEADPSAFTHLSLRIKTLSSKLLPLVVHAISGSGRSAGVDVLLSLLGRGSELDVLLLREVAALAERTSGTLPDDRLGFIRPFVSDTDWRVRREAVIALGRLQDFRSCERLIAALADEQRLVGQSALWALCRMSGKDWDADKRRWERWFEVELGWFEQSGARLVETLEDKDPARVIEAMRELCQRPLFKHECAAALAPLLAHADARVVTSVCASLAELGSRVACPALVDALAHDDQEVRVAACAALKRLTGRTLAPQFAAWSSALRG